MKTKNNETKKDGIKFKAMAFLAASVLMIQTPASFAAEPLLNSNQNLTPVKTLSDSSSVPVSNTATGQQAPPALAEMDQPLSLASAVGTPPVVQGTAYNASRLTTLTGSPAVYASKHDDDNDASVTLNQTSNREFNVNYSLADSSDFVFAWISFSEPQKMGSAVFALNGPAGKQLKVEFRDTSGKTAVFYAALTGIKQNYTFSMWGSAIPAGFNPSLIENVAFVADQNISASSGTFSVETKGLGYTAVLSGNSYNSAAITNLPGQPSLFSGKGDFDNNSNVTLGQTSSSNFGFNYQLSNGNFGFSGLRLSQPRNLGSSVTMALNGPAGKQIKIEIKDAAGKIASAYANLTGTFQNYTFALNADTVPLGFDLTRIQEIVFVAESYPSGNSGSVQIEIRGLLPPAVPTVVPIPSVDTWRALPGIPIPAGVASAPATASMTAASTTSATLTYNTSTVGWAGGGYTFDNPATAAIETVNLAGFSNLTFALQGNPSQVKFEMIDNQNRKTSIYLSAIRSDIEQIWVIPISTLQGIDLTKVRTFYFIVEGQQKTGSLTVTTQENVIKVNQRDGAGNITNAEVRLTDGRIYQISSSNNTITVTRFNSPGGPAVESFPLYNTLLKDLHFVQTKNADPFLFLQKETIQSNGTRTVDPGILALPQSIPMVQPYVPATSNPNYAFYDDSTFTIFCSQHNLFHCGGELALVDLRSGQIRHLASNSDQPLGDTFTSRSYDVTPDGNYVVFEAGRKDYVQGNSYWTVLQSIGDLNKKILTPINSYAGPIKSLGFSSYGSSFVVVRFKDKNGVERYIVYDLAHGTSKIS